MLFSSLRINELFFFCFSCDVSNRLSRESSQDILVEDLDRLSTTSAMSESSVSHRLNDVQDVQDIARMQEESKFITTIPTRADLSPLVAMMMPNKITLDYNIIIIIILSERCWQQY